MRWVQLLVALGACTLILLLQRPDRFLRPQFWAEDGAVFFREAHLLGIASLVTPYNGYFHTAPRLVALAAEHLVAARFAPLLYFLASLTVIWLVVVLLHLPRLGLRWPILPSMTLVAAPVLGEVYLNLTNVLWILLLAQILLLALPEPGSRRGQVAEVAVHLLCALTGPFVIFLLPVFFLRWYVLRSGYALLLLVVALVSAVVQGMGLGTSRVAGSFSWLNADFVRLIARPLHVVLHGPRVEMDPSLLHEQIALALITVLGTALLLLRAYRQRQVPAGVVLGSGVLVLVAVLISVRNDPATLVGGGERYFHTFPVCALWAMLFFWEGARDWGRWGIWLAYVLLMSSTLLHLVEYRAAPLQPLRWGRASACIDKGERCVIPINPPGWNVVLE